MFQKSSVWLGSVQRCFSDNTVISLEALIAGMEDFLLLLSSQHLLFLFCGFSTS